MGWFSKRKRAGITNPVSGQLQVVACSPFPGAAGEVIVHPKCVIDGVITAERLVPTVVHYSGYGVPKPKWPRPGVVLPVTVDIADPKQFRIEWDQVPTGREAAEGLAKRLHAEQLGEPQANKSGDHAFPRVWREVKYAASSPTRVNGPTFVGAFKEFAILDQLKLIADERDTNVAAVALAWVQSRPGVSSTIIGARRMDQLDANLAALDVILSTDQIGSLDTLTQPTLNFPADLLRNLSLNRAHAGATVNGEPSVRLASLLPTNADEAY